MFLSALLAASLSAPVPKALKVKTVEEIVIGRWELTGHWKRLSDPDTYLRGDEGEVYEFRENGVVVRTDGADDPKLPTVKGKYTLAEPDNKHDNWWILLEFPKADDSGIWELFEVGERRLRLINGVIGSKEVFDRVKDDKPKK